MNEYFYWALCVVVVLAILIKGRSARSQQSVRSYLGGAVLISFAAFFIGFAFDRTSPIDILLLRQSADIYSIFLISVAYGMLLHVVIGIASGAGPKNSNNPSP
jgi:hypothetical protein